MEAVFGVVGCQFAGGGGCCGELAAVEAVFGVVGCQFAGVWGAAMKAAAKSAWWHRLLLVGLVMAMVAAALLLGASSMRTWMDQNAQRREAESLATELDARIAELDAEVARRTSDDGVRREALCFGPYVEPGTEVYAVMGLEGCVSQPQDP